MQNVVSMDAIRDVIIMIVCPENYNLIDNVSHMNIFPSEFLMIMSQNMQ